jgi:hypothetical protein
MRQPLRWRTVLLTSVTPGKSYQFQQAKPGQIIRITHISVYNTGTVTGSVYWEVVTQEGTYQVAKGMSVGAAGADFDMVEFYLLEGDQFQVRGLGSAGNGPLYVFVSGELITPENETIIL